MRRSWMDTLEGLALQVSLEVATRCFVRKGVLRNFTKFTGKKNPCQSFFKIKLQA